MTYKHVTVGSTVWGLFFCDCISTTEKLRCSIVGNELPCVFKKRGQLKHNLPRTQQTQINLWGATLDPSPWCERAARIHRKPLSLLITDVLCRQGGNLWYFMHSQFRWSSSPLSVSVALKWQHHYCLSEHSGDTALFPLAWWNGSCVRNDWHWWRWLHPLSLSQARCSYLW